MAASDTGRRIRAAACRVLFEMKLVTTLKRLSGATFTTKSISKDSGSFSAVTNAPVEIGSTGVYYVDLTATEMDARDHALIFTASDANAADTEVHWQTEGGLTSGTAQSGSTSSTLKMAAGTTASDFADCTVEIVRGTGAGQVRTIISGSTVTATVDRNWTTTPDGTSVYLVHPQRNGVFTGNGYQDANAAKVGNSATAATMLANVYNQGVIPSSVNDGAPTTTGFIGAAGLSATNNFYVGSFVLFTSGTLKGLARKVTAYAGSTLTFAFDEAWPVAPANADTFVIIGHTQ